MDVGQGVLQSRERGQLLRRRRSPSVSLMSALGTGSPTLQDPGRFRAWVVGIARQLVRELRRRRQPELLGRAVPAVAADPTTPADDADEVEHVLRLVSQLPEQERLAVHLFYLSKRDANETARLLNLSRSGTYALLKRACARLARWLGVPEREREVQP
jgi:RNA polymerase sigma factor (sigma-70 family)